MGIESNTSPKRQVTAVAREEKKEERDQHTTLGGGKRDGRLNLYPKTSVNTFHV